MKKILLLLSCLSILLFTPSADAVFLNYIDYKGLELEHSFVVGDYVFDLTTGYSPSLQDFMIASRTIPSSVPVYVEEITIIDIPELDYHEFSSYEVYSKRNITNSSQFVEINPKYVYRNNIDGADEEDYTVLS